MGKKNSQEIVVKERSKGHGAVSVEEMILTIRGQKVILDADLARLYGVETRALNQAVKRNRDKFPEDFAFVLTNKEVMALRSQIVISKHQRQQSQSATVSSFN